MHPEESHGERLRRLEQQITRLQHDAKIWQRAGEHETAEELRALAAVLRGAIETIVRTEQVLSFVRPPANRRDD